MRKAFRVDQQLSGKGDHIRNPSYAIACITVGAQPTEAHAILFTELLPALDGPIDLESLVEALPTTVLASVAAVARRAMGLLAREPSPKAAGARRR